jgi:hypothetical protein
VVERAEEQRGIRRLVGFPQLPGVAPPRRERRRVAGQPPRLRDQLRHQVDQLHVVAVGGQPGRMGSGAAPDVEHASRRRGQGAPQELLDAPQLELPAPHAQPLALVRSCAVELDDAPVGHGCHSIARLSSPDPSTFCVSAGRPW